MLNKVFCLQRNNELNVCVSKIWWVPDYARKILASKGNKTYRSFSLTRNKKNKLKTIQWKKLRNCDIIEDKKKDTSPSFRPVRLPKLQIFVEMFRRNLQSPV